MKKNMRLLKNICSVSFFVSLFTLTLFSCNIVSTPIQVVESSNVTFEELVQIKASIINYNKIQNNDSSLYSSPASARSVNPTLQAQTYDFYLFGQKSVNETSGSFGPLKVEDLDGQSGTFSLNIPRGTWYLTLAAYEKGFNSSQISITKISEQALLTGYALSDFSTSGTTTSFVLEAAGLKTKGKINLKINLENWKLSDYNPESFKLKGNILSASSKSLTVISELDISETGDKDTYFIFNPTDEFSPGKYLLKLIFYKTSDSSVNFTWQDELYVYPGLETDTELHLAKLINQLPAAPENFAFALESKDTISDYGDYYLGTFNWTVPAAGTTATEYELRLYDEGEGKEYITYTTRNQGSILRKDGSLNVPSTSITLWLPLGKKLSAQLRAKNKTGTSDNDWTGTKIENINLYRITYNLQGGTTQDETFGQGTTNQTGPFFDYGSINTAPHTWIVPGEDKIIYKPEQNNVDQVFNYWTESTAENALALDTTSNDGKYNGYSNVELYANYKPKYTHPLENTDEVLIAYYSDNNKTISLASNNTITISNNFVSNIPVVGGAAYLDLFIFTKGFKYKEVKTTYTYKPILLGSEKETDISVKENETETQTYNSTEYNSYHFKLNTKGWSKGEREIIFEATFGEEQEQLKVKIKIE